MSIQSSDLDFTQCFLCQQIKNESLSDPKKKKVSNDGEDHCFNTYRTLANIILEFHAEGLHPFEHDIDELNSYPGGLVNLLQSNHALYHKSCRTKLNNTKLQRARKRTSKEPLPVPTKTRASSTNAANNTLTNESEISSNSICILCDRPQGDEKLSKCSTFGIDYKIRQCAHVIGDQDLIGKLSVGDLIAIDACYHLKCLIGLYRKAKAVESSDDNEAHLTKVIKAQAFADLVSYIESLRDSCKSIKMSDVCKLYSTRLQTLGLQNEYVHSTRLRQDLKYSVQGLVQIQNPSNQRYF